MEIIAYSSEHKDVYRHLAAEELILRDLAPGTLAVYLWQADDAMVIGKNQNPWLECDLPMMAMLGCSLARRISGGGAVFHDAGNLNYSFFMEKTDYERDRLSRIILSALEQFSIHGVIGERHLLEVNRKKFSGNAFCYRHNKVLHHGTLLVDADLDKLVRFAEPTCGGIEAKGIRSIPSAVANLTDYNPELTVAKLKRAIYNEVRPTVIPCEFTHPDLDDKAAEFRSDSWCFHRTPRFLARGTCPNTCALFEAEVVRGVVKSLSSQPKDHDFESEMAGLDFRDFLKQNPDLTLK